MEAGWFGALVSNDKNAYGWSGHILVSDAEYDKKDRPEHEGVVIVPDMAFQSIIKAMENCKLDDGINVERLGVTDSDYYFLACGHPATFSMGYQYYGTIFDNAEDRVEGGNVVDPEDRDKEYMKAMKDIYGLDLPRCRLMVGCSTEH